MPASIEEVLQEIWTNPATKQKLESDPKAFLQGYGVQVPAGVNVVLHEDTFTSQNFVLPETPVDAQPDTQDPVAKVLQRAQQDSAFKAEVLSDPKAAARSVGVAVPDSVEIKVHQNSPTTMHLVLPTNPADAELNDADLEAVSGGFVKSLISAGIRTGVQAGVKFAAETVVEEGVNQGVNALAGAVHNRSGK